VRQLLEMTKSWLSSALTLTLKGEGSLSTEPSRSCYACRSSSACRFTVPVCRRRAAQTQYAWVGTYNPNGEGLYRFTVDAKPARCAIKRW
jgi:hypothetical protein